MLCAKIGGECPHPVTPNDKLVFVLMPFKGFKNIYDQIQLAVEGIDGKDFNCERADDEYTSFSIWCERICKNIRKAKYLIVDTTGKNANVFYELGFAHSFGDKKAVLITQNLKDAPFDVADLNHITYTPDDFRRLREDIQKALLALEKIRPKRPVVKKSRDEIIRELKSQLRTEEQRGTKFKKELYEAEERVTQYKARIKELDARIKELESTKAQPSAQAKNKIAKLEETISDLKAQLKTETENRQTNQKEIDRLTRALKEKENKLKTPEKKPATTKSPKKKKPAATTKSDDTQRKKEAKMWFEKGISAYLKGNEKLAIKYYSKTIELSPEDAEAYKCRATAHYFLDEHQKSIKDHDKAIELDSEDAESYFNRGISYDFLGEYQKAINDHNKAIKLDPENAVYYCGRGDVYSSLGQYEKAIKDYDKAIELDPGYSDAIDGRKRALKELKK